MAFSVSDTGAIATNFTDSLNEAFGGSSGGGNPNKVPLGVNQSVLLGPNLPATSVFGASDWQPQLWSGNAYNVGFQKRKYGFAIIKGSELLGSLDFSSESDSVFYLQTAPTSIQQKEIFGTNVQATRKGVIVESEGVVFKDIIISGNTGIFPGERGGSTTPSPNFSNFTSAPEPPSGVNPLDGTSKKSAVTTVSGYQEFIALRQFFLTYAQKKVETKGDVFFAWLNQKDNDYFVVEPLDFIMERDARAPLTYNYKITLKAIAKLDDFVVIQESESAANFLDQIANVAANVTATIDSLTEIVNASVGALLAITQALDNTFLTPVQQFKHALNAINSGINTTLSLPASLIGNAENVSTLTLATADSAEDVNTITNDAATSQSATDDQLKGGSSGVSFRFTTNSLGEVTDTGPSNKQASTSTAQDASTINGKIPNIIDSDGNLSTVLTPEQYTVIRDIVAQLADDSLVPLPRSFVEDLKTNTITLRDDLADSIGAGSTAYDDIYGRTVTQLAPPLAVPTDEQFILLGALQEMIGGLNKILCNNEFFESGAEEIYSNAQNTYGQIADINKPDNVVELVINSGDTLEKIALRHYGDALRWVDLVVLNRLKAPYISTDSGELPEGVKRSGDKILAGNV